MTILFKLWLPRVCEQGVTYPITVPPGFYSVPVDGPPSRRVDKAECVIGAYCRLGSQAPCPAGTYGATLGESSESCTGPCSPGYFCTAGSTSPTQSPCGGNDVYCGAGSASPHAVALGDRTIGGDATTRSGVEPCPSGSYCVSGVAAPCLAGRFGCATGLWEPECNGKCTPGFYCPAGANSSRFAECGGAQYYCPEGSAAPAPVPLGYYSVGGVSSRQQSGIALCPAGSYCVDGVKVHRGSVQHCCTRAWLRVVVALRALVVL